MSQKGASKRGRAVERIDLERIENALRDLGAARDNLRNSGCHSAALKVRLAISSTRGALNNAWSQYQRARRT